MKNYFVLVFIFSYFLTNSNLAQNQFFVHPEGAKNFYNPAIINTSNPLSFTVIHRNTYIHEDVSLINTVAGIDVPIRYSYKFFPVTSFSLYFFDDRLNKTGFLRQTGGLFSISQQIRISHSSLMSLGIQFARYITVLGMSQFYTGAQWDSNLGFIPSLPNGENFVHHNFSTSILSSGIWWQMIDMQQSIKVYIGLAGFNLNRPLENYTDRPSRLIPRYTIMAGYKIFDNKKIMIIPEISMYSLNMNPQISLGIKTGIYTIDNNPFLPFRKGQLVFISKYVNRNTCLGFMLEQPIYTISVLYDFPMYEGQIKNTRALELHLTIKFGRSKTTSVVHTAQEYSVGQVRKFFNEQEEKKTTITQGTKEQEMTTSMLSSSDKATKPITLALRKDFKFGFNDATLDAEACQYLDELAELLRGNENIHIEIIGHTDDVGTREANRIISYRRAQVVADYLINKGIASRRIKVVGKLDSEPLFPNTSPENRAKNRRVEFVLYYYQPASY